jgi:hypothetical protein
MSIGNFLLFIFFLSFVLKTFNIINFIIGTEKRKENLS